jgi:hypothetical protein
MSHIHVWGDLFEQKIFFVLPQNEKAHFFGLRLCGAMFLWRLDHRDFFSGLVRDGTGLSGPFEQLSFRLHKWRRDEAGTLYTAVVTH